MNYKAFIQEKLNLDDLQYGTMVYKQGLRWIDRFFGVDPFFCGLIEQSKPFWQWWINQWNNRDGIFVQNHPQLLMIEGPLEGAVLWATFELYADHHDFKQLNIELNRMVQDDIRRKIRAYEKEIADQAVKQKMRNNGIDI